MGQRHGDTRPKPSTEEITSSRQREADGDITGIDSWRNIRTPESRAQVRTGAPNGDRLGTTDSGHSHSSTGATRAVENCRVKVDATPGELYLGHKVTPADPAEPRPNTGQNQPPPQVRLGDIPDGPLRRPRGIQTNAPAAAPPPNGGQPDILTRGPSGNPYPPLKRPRRIAQPTRETPKGPDHKSYTHDNPRNATGTSSRGPYHSPARRQVSRQVPNPESALPAAQCRIISSQHGCQSTPDPIGAAAQHGESITPRANAHPFQEQHHQPIGDSAPR